MRTREIKELLILGRLQIRQSTEAELSHLVSGFFESTPVKGRAFVALLERMQQRGWIGVGIQSPTSSLRNDPNVRQITAEGKDRFKQLMLRQSTRGDPFRESFRAKLLNLGHVGQPTRQRIARDYIRRVIGLQIQAISMQGEFMHDAVLPTRFRSTVLRAIRHDRAVAEAEIDWMRTELSEYL